MGMELALSVVYFSAGLRRRRNRGGGRSTDIQAQQSRAPEHTLPEPTSDLGRYCIGIVHASLVTPQPPPPPPLPPHTHTLFGIKGGSTPVVYLSRRTLCLVCVLFCFMFLGVSVYVSMHV